MFVNGKEFTHCRKCHILVKTGGTINRMVLIKTWNKHLKIHASVHHPNLIDKRI
jgi:hypothetical protein